MNADSHAVVSDRMNRIDMMPEILFIMSILSGKPRSSPPNAGSQTDVLLQNRIDQMVAGACKLGNPAKYDRKLALYAEESLAYVKTTRPIEVSR